jgi:hypothetical protein
MERVNIGGALDADYTKFTLSYDFYNPANDTDPGSIKEGNTQYKWYKRLTDTSYAVTADRTYYVAIPGGTTKSLLLTNKELAITTGLRCEITVYDSTGQKGATVTVDATPPYSTTYSTSPSVSLLSSTHNALTGSTAIGMTVSVLTSYAPNPALTGSVKVFAATYDKNGKMLNVKEDLIEDASDGLISLIPDFTIASNTAAVKVFLWNGDTLIPVIDPVLVK